jgi:hypothetical protein
MNRILISGDSAYVVLRMMPIHKFGKDEPDLEKVKLYRDWVKADHVMKSATDFIFCETIKEAEIIEEIILDKPIEETAE